jgi:hypothetical protein
VASAARRRGIVIIFQFCAARRRKYEYGEEEHNPTANVRSLETK